MKSCLNFGVEKQDSHLKNIEIWRELSGRFEFLPGEQYWTLADPNSIEFDSVHNSGILQRPNQYHGINDDPDKISALRAKHKMVDKTNFHAGDWCLVVDNERPCPCGGIIYIDSMNQPDQIRAKASTMLVAAMRSCGPGTLICMNVCGESLHGKILPFNAFWANVRRQVPSTIADLWQRIEDKYGNTDFLPPKTNTRQMCCMFFWRIE
jgi:hypothetical protein